MTFIERNKRRSGGEPPWAISRNLWPGTGRGAKRTRERRRSSSPSIIPFTPNRDRNIRTNPNRKIFEARKRETAALGAGEKLVLGHPLAATIGDSARCMQNLEKVLFTGPKTSDTVTFICD